MLGSLVWAGLLLGFAPLDQPAVGPPTPALDLSSPWQVAASAGPGARGFRARWGPWAMRWNNLDGTPHALVGGGVDVEEADALVADVASLAGVDADDLDVVASRSWRDRSVRVYAQSWRGAPVEGGVVEVFAQRGRIHYVRVGLHRVRGLADPVAGERVLPVDEGDRLSYRLVTRRDEGDEVVFVDRVGVEVHRYTHRRHLDVTCEESTVDDPLIRGPARGVTVMGGEGKAVTDDEGRHPIPPPFSVALDGPLLTVLDDGQLVRVHDVQDAVLDGGVDMTLSAGTVLHHFHVGWDWLRDVWPEHPWLDDNVPATVDISANSCNAYYTNGTINFYRGDRVCHNFGRIADVVYHELGHGIHHYILEAGIFAGDVSEGSSDYVACTIENDPVLAENAWTDGTSVREIDTDRFYPDDAIGQVHNDGLIWASFLWNLRELWIGAYGFEEGVRQTDQLFLATLAYGPRLVDIYESVLAADDDDGDLTNGTPRICDLAPLLAHHGLGPGPTGVIVLDHEPLALQQGSATDGYPVAWTMHDAAAACSSFDPDSATVYYAVDPDPDAPLEELVFEAVVGDRTGNDYTATIPRQPPGSAIAYYLGWSTVDGTEHAASHGGRLDGLSWSYIGDTEPLWCDDFEEGIDDWDHAGGVPFDVDDEMESDWEVAEPTGAPGTPSEAVSGDHVFGTALTADDGEYARNNDQFALAPSVVPTAPARSLLLLTYERFLTIEDGIYDVAQVVGFDGDGPQVLWTNETLPVGPLDTEWTRVAHDVRRFADAKAMQIAFTLSADGGLEYGGWAVDDVCIETLADAEGHYRAQGLVASDAGPLTIDWTQPYVSPLYATALVRKEEGFPTSVEDGVIVDLDLQPEAGGTRTVVDELAVPGVTYHYALFAADGPDHFYRHVAVGLNADLGRASGGGCGCGVDAGGTGLLAILAGLVAWGRRQQRG